MAARRKTRARRRRRAGFFDPGALLRRHVHALRSSLEHLAQRPWASAMTSCVLGVALALPTGLLVGVRNLEQLGTGWLAPDQAAVFLVEGLDDAAAESVRAQLAADEAVDSAELVTREQALEEFRARSGLDEALGALDGNPLPHVVTLVLNEDVSDTASLFTGFESRDEVDFVQYDQLWAERFENLLALARRTAWVAAAALLLAVFLTIGNTIRMDIGSRREEIEVTRLVGGSDAFIRQPFLYGGLWYGLAAGLLAAVLVGLALFLIQPPLDRLGEAYGTDLRLTGLSLRDLGKLVALSALIGWAGSGLAVARHLSRIQPR